MAVAYLVDKYQVSEHRACRVVGMHRSSYRYRGHQNPGEIELMAAVHRLTLKHPRYGYRLMHAKLRQEGFEVGVWKVRRLLRREGIRVPRKVRRRHRFGTSGNAVSRGRGECPNHVWAWDFVHTTDVRGRKLKWLVIMDEFTRQCVSLRVARRMPAVDVIDAFAAAVGEYGAPGYIRSDNGPEFVAKRIRRFLAGVGSGTKYIAPGSPWENGSVESFNGRMRDELLDMELCEDAATAQRVADVWRLGYNHERPHSALKYQCPSAFAAQRREQTQRPGSGKGTGGDME